LDFESFVQVSLLIEYKLHLTNYGLDHIKGIKSGMNTIRVHDS